MAPYLKNVALIGASGNLGSKTLDALVKQDKHKVTVITRPFSTATYPPSVKVEKGEYKDAAFLEAALRGQDVLVIMLGFAGMQHQDAIIEAAANAGVRYVLSTEYGAPSGDERQVKAIPIIQGKGAVRTRIEALVMKWVGVVTNMWIDYSLQYGVFDILIPERKATLYPDSAPFNVPTLERVAAAIAAFLALPAEVVERDFANNYLFVLSFRLTQPKIFSAILRTTGTSKTEWKAEKKTTQDLIDEGREMSNAGHMAGRFRILYGVNYQTGMGGDYSDHNSMLGLGVEDLDEVVRATGGLVAA